MFVVVIALYGYHLYLLRHGEGVRITVGQAVFRLGVEVGAGLPANVDAAYYKGGVNKGQQIRIPKYANNAVFVSEAGGVIRAKDVDSGEVGTYRWGKYTIYRCGNAATTKPPAYLNLQTTPIQDLKNYLLVVTGDYWEEPLKVNELAMFRADVMSGNPVKLYTLSDSPDSSGKKELAAVFVFTSHQYCLRPSAVPGAGDVPGAGK